MTTKGQIFDSLTDGVSNILDDKIGDSMSFLQGGWKTLTNGQSMLRNKLFQMQQAVHDKFDTLNNITNIVHTIAKWDETDEETGQKIFINLKKKINDLNTKIEGLENTVVGLSNQNSNMSGQIKSLDDKIKVIDHKLDIVNNRFMDINGKLEILSSMIVPRKETIASPVTPPVEVPTESVIPLTKPKDDLLNFLGSNRIKDMLKINGSSDRLEDQVLEITMYINR